MSSPQKITANSFDAEPVYPWRALFWEPVSGTGERLMVGVVFHFGNEWQATRILRDDVLDAMYGSAAGGAKNLIDTSLKMFVAMAAAEKSIAPLSFPVMGLFPGDLRQTGAHSAADLLRTACLLYSSIANIDRVDEADESDAPSPAETTRDFANHVREIVLIKRPDLSRYFGAKGAISEGGKPIKFGFLSPRAAFHFSIIHPMRIGPSIRDAHARLFELQNVKAMTGVPVSELITAIPHPDDPTLGDKQRKAVKETCDSINQEAAGAGLTHHKVITFDLGAERILEVA